MFIFRMPRENSGKFSLKALFDQYRQVRTLKLRLKIVWKKVRSFMNEPEGEKGIFISIL